MIALVYVSSAAYRPNDDALKALLATCHRNNARLGVTGLLLYNDAGTFIQALEGEAEIVDALYENIKRDPRHSRVHCLGRREITSRGFPKWKMGFRHLGSHAFAQDSDLSSIVAKDDLTDFLARNTHFAYDLLSHFKKQSEEIADL